MIIASTSVKRENENEKKHPTLKENFSFVLHQNCLAVLGLTLEQILYSNYMDSVACLLSFGGKQIQITN